MLPTLEFKPDLIVEATAVCDRQCPGCYAPNLVSKKESREDLYSSFPGLFLQVEKLRLQFDRLALVNTRLEVVAVRGGEPSRHPYLRKILKLCSEYCFKTYLETHGRWILNFSDAYTQEILTTCREREQVIKLSYDQMHGLGSLELKRITEILSSFGVSWVIAITEVTQELFLKTRASCCWIPDEGIIFQKKAKNDGDLVLPRFGVIHADGTQTSSLKTVISFKKKDTGSQTGVQL